jgi:hypothetical protein
MSSRSSFHRHPWLLAMTMTMAATATVLATGCGPKPKPVRSTVEPDAAPAPPPPMGKITVDCEPVEAQIIVDDQPRGTAEEITRLGGMELPQGHHRIEIKLDGYAPFRFELILGKKPETIKVRLRATGKRQP